MNRLMLAFALTALAAGCNKTTTTGTHVLTKRSDTATVVETVQAKLSVVAKEAQTVARGATDKVTILINRDHFNDPVTVTLSGLPKGVTVEEKELLIPGDSNSVTATLKADKDAPVGDAPVTITAKSNAVPDNKQTFKLTVK